MFKKLLILTLAIAVNVSAGYDPENEISKRLENFRKVCDKYNNDLTYEHRVLWGTNHEPTNWYSSEKKKFTVCVPPKTSAQSWIALMKQMSYFDRAEMTDEEKEAIDKIPEKEKFTSAFKALVVRHPLERILSAYRYSLGDSTIIEMINRKAFAMWLPHRPDIHHTEPDEETRNELKEPALSFRQFVNFLTDCPAEMDDCAMLASTGPAYHWSPFWASCTNLCHFGLDAIISMDHTQEDKEYIFNKVGLNNTYILEHKNRSGYEHSSKVAQKYYGRLLKTEIYKLYQKYRLDHELFGFKPDEYISFGRDQI